MTIAAGAQTGPSRAEATTDDGSPVMEIAIGSWKVPVLLSWNTTAAYRPGVMLTADTSPVSEKPTLTFSNCEAVNGPVANSPAWKGSVPEHSMDVRTRRYGPSLLTLRISPPSKSKSTVLLPAVRRPEELAKPNLVPSWAANSARQLQSAVCEFTLNRARKNSKPGTPLLSTPTAETKPAMCATPRSNAERTYGTVEPRFAAD